MKLRNLITSAIFIISISIIGCGLFGKKSPDNEKSEKQIMQEQQDLKRKVDSLKNLKIDKELDSLKIVLDSSSKNLNETMQKILKSDEMKKENGPKTK